MNKILLGVTAVMAIGCGPSRYLLWRSAPSAPSVAGKLAFEINDRREPKRGGEDKQVVGVGTGSFGIPMDIRLSSPSELPDSLRDWAGQAALAAGIGVAPMGDPSPTAKAMIDIQQLWCSGFAIAFKADVTLMVTIVDPATNTVRVPGMLIHADDGDTDCRGAYRSALSKAFETATNMFLSPNVKAAVTAAIAAPPPPPPGDQQQQPPPPAQ